MEKGWSGLPYYPISDFYKSHFGGKVYKIPVAIVDDCPNRRGLKGMKTCVFCDVWGSAARHETMTLDLKNQIEKVRTIIKKKYNANQFLVYFQAYTNSFAKIAQLEAQFEAALSEPDVIGLVVGTRPDCISPTLFKLWQKYHEKSFVSVELGVQSFNNKTLEFYRRGHSAEDSISAIKKIKQETSVDLGVHLMFGAPQETHDEIIKSAELISDLPVDNVKLHNLHVLKNTPLAELYEKKEFIPIERIEYAQRVELFLQHLSPKVAVHRLAAFSSRWDELVAPEWTRDKMGTHQILVDFLRSRGSSQSQYYKSKNDTERELCLKLQKQSQSSAVHLQDLVKSLQSRLTPEEQFLNSGL